MTITGKYRGSRQGTDREPLDFLMEAMRSERDIAAEYISDSPGWAQVFIGANLEDAGSSSPVVVTTYDGEDWCLTIWENSAGFYSEDESTKQELIHDHRGTDTEAVIAAARKLLAAGVA